MKIKPKSSNLLDDAIQLFWPSKASKIEDKSETDHVGTHHWPGQRARHKTYTIEYPEKLPKLEI